MNEWLLFLWILIGIFAVVLAANWIQIKFKITSESIRIFVHVLIFLKRYFISMSKFNYGIN